jgi:hypothetical protein
MTTRSPRLVDATRATGKNQPARPMLLDLLRGDVMPHNLAVNVLLTHPTGNQLGKLRTKIEHENSLLSGLSCRSSGRFARRTYFQTTVHDRQDSSPTAQAAASRFCTVKSWCSRISLERKRKLPLSQRQLETPNYITRQPGQKSRKRRLICHQFGAVPFPHGFSPLVSPPTRLHWKGDICQSLTPERFLSLA